MLGYWRELTRFLVDRRRAPRGPGEIMPWSMARVAHLWNDVCHPDGDTFAGYVLRSGVNLPAFVVRRRAVVVAALYAWPLVAWAVTRRHGPDARTHWRRALRRPDLYAAFPRVAFSERAAAERRSDMIHAVANAWDYRAGRSPDYAIEDKRVFATRARDAGLPTVPTLSLEDAGAVGGPFIVKDPTRDMGLGVEVVDTCDALRARVGRGPAIVQPLLCNHAALRDVLPPNAPLCTLRLLTTSRSEGTVCHIAYFRVGAAGSPVDNLSRGGTLVEVDLDSGRLMNGVVYEALQGRAPVGPGVDRVRGAARPFAGRRLPHFDESVALVTRAHAAIAPSILSVGWDVALTDAGPVLVEANVYAGSYEIFQFRNSYDVGIRAILERVEARTAAARDARGAAAAR